MQVTLSKEEVGKTGLPIYKNYDEVPEGLYPSEVKGDKRFNRRKLRRIVKGAVKDE